ncbi:pyridoxamine 5'-phosphate oxidase family protein [Nesterenkonia alkaliphila]|uniref:Pyridoxamine 5'-phosphate oxidase family protein n=1 Tax=Nesterenkonia alkaliphila TaxID=1463631 RepID=A0A7K1UGN4_9MICC|nr:pyridoxamine 5'-phosphate oxidase family protein [Nesterenkonia alkaliphila]MVT25251.1 pyridoxamine 5'-phosphate oxidase family protein [Nesterenkonia alkaliphila]GFZ91460.1 hypothetical protein GCM10011359_20990 [Nesterenkonia alkaliphila]
MQVVGTPSENMDLEEFLGRPLFAHLATSSDEGARDVPLWFLWEDSALWFIVVVSENTFHQRVQKNPRTAVGIVDFDVNTGLVQHVSFRGRATVEPWDVEKAKRVLSKYLGNDMTRWDQKRFVEGLDHLEDWLFVKFQPETVMLRDQSYRPS